MDIPQPLCRWTFQEPAGEPRQSSGRYAYSLIEQAGPIARVEGGVKGCGPFAAEIKEGQWLRIRREDCPELNLHGPNARVTVVAWVKRTQKSNGECEAVAGMWNETHKSRQYCLFLNLKIWDSNQQVCGHLSSTGAPSPGYKYCMEAAIGASPVALGQWHHAAFTFDGIWARAYLDGRWDERPGLNPYFWPCAINNGGPGGSDFTVAAVDRSGLIGNWYTGLLGGLAVYDVALTGEQIAELHRREAV